MLSRRSCLLQDVAIFLEGPCYIQPTGPSLPSTPQKQGLDGSGLGATISGFQGFFAEFGKVCWPSVISRVAVG